MRQRKLLTNEIFVYTGSGLARNLTAMLAGIVTLRWVMPLELGVWNSLLLAQIYLNGIRLGVVNGMNRELAFLHGAGREDEARAIAATSQFYILLCALMGILLTLVFLILKWDHGWLWRAAIFGIVVVIPCDFFFSYLEGTFRTSLDFLRLARINYVIAGMNLVSIALVPAWGFTGYCMRFALLSFMNMSLAFWLRPIRVRPRFETKSFISLLKTGLPLHGQNYINQVALSMDRTILAFFGSLRLLGLYAPALSLGKVVTSVGDILSTYFSPKIASELGKKSSRQDIWKMTVNALSNALMSGLAIAVVAWVAVPVLVRNLFPKYIESLPVIRIALLGTVFLNSRVAYSAICMMRAWKPVFISSFLNLLLRASLPFVFIKFFGILRGVAWGNVASAFLSAILIVGFVRRELKKKVPV